MIGGVVLAAGSGRRMGGPKALLELDGETLLQRAARLLAEAGCSPVFAVVGDWDPGDVDAFLVLNAEAAEGMASSIRAGVRALPKTAPAALFLTVDQPAVDEPLLRRLLALAAEEIDIEQVKWVVLMVLFSQPDEANAYARMEDLVFEEQTEHALH